MKALASRISVVLLSVLLASCIVLPLSEGPSPDTRQNISDEVPTFIVPGVTTRADVLLRLGEPDGTSEHDLQFTYTKGVRTGGLAFVMCGALNCVGGQSEKMVYDRLTIQFDDKNVVISTWHERVACRESEVANHQSGPCAKFSGQDLLTSQIKAADGVVFPNASWCRGVRVNGWKAFPQGCPTGSLVITNSAVLLYPGNADIKSGPVLTAPYTGIARVEIVKDILFLVEGVAFMRLDGSYDSIAIGVKQNGQIVDYQSTEKAGTLLLSRWQAATGK